MNSQKKGVGAVGQWFGRWGILGLAVGLIHADTYEPNTHQVQRSVVILNVDKFPDYDLIGYIPYNGSKYVVKQGERLRGHKSGAFTLYGVKKSYLTAIKGVDHIKMKKAPSFLDMIRSLDPAKAKEMEHLPKEMLEARTGSDEVADENLLPCDLSLEPEGHYVDNQNPLIKEEVEYTLTGFAGRKAHLYKSKQVSTYNDGTPKKIEVMAQPPSMNLEPAPKAEVPKVKGARSK